MVCEKRVDVAAFAVEIHLAEDIERDRERRERRFRRPAFW